MNLKDYGKDPLTINIEAATLQNENFRTTLWTGDFFQVTLMSIPVGGDIGLEIHKDTDQFLRLEQGKGKVQMGDSKEDLSYEKEVAADDVVIVHSGKYHNITNIGDIPMKVYSIYAPPHHPKGTIHETQDDAVEEEGHEL